MPYDRVTLITSENQVVSVGSSSSALQQSDAVCHRVSVQSACRVVYRKTFTPCSVIPRSYKGATAVIHREQSARADMSNRMRKLYMRHTGSIVDN
eukprot:3146-Heterococcus_DN1.PRE.1